jgi:hypothetical protein
LPFFGVSGAAANEAEPNTVRVPISKNAGFMNYPKFPNPIRGERLRKKKIRPFSVNLSSHKANLRIHRWLDFMACEAASGVALW